VASKPAPRRTGGKSASRAGTPWTPGGGHEASTEESPRAGPQIDEEIMARREGLEPPTLRFEESKKRQK